MEHKKIEIFGNTHSLSILMYLTDHSGCTKTDLYQEVVRNSRMPDKLNVLEKAGLIHQVQDGRSTRLYITSKGLEVAKYRFEIEDILHKP